jgi:glycosidase
MQWTGEAGAGFSSGRPWLRLGPDYRDRNVARQREEPDSILACYRRLIRFRRTAAPLQRGTMARLRAGVDDVLAWVREADGRRLLVLVNFVGEERTVDLAAIVGGTDWAARVGTHPEPSAPAGDGRLTLAPDEAVILESGDA